MKLPAKILCASTLFLCLFAIPALCQEISIEIDISPSTLNLAYQGQVVTVHTDIAYSLVDGASVALNGIEIAWWKSDDRGYFVAKFNVDDVKGIVKPGTNELTLKGVTKEGSTFCGTSTIRVISVGDKK